MGNSDVFEYRNGSRHVIWVVISAVFFAAIGSLVDNVYVVVCWGLALIFFVYAAYLAIDSRVKLRMDAEGLSGGRVSKGKIAWSEIERFAHIDESRNGVVVKQFLQVQLRGGEKIDVEISRLDASEAKILQTVETFTGPLHLD